MGPIYLSMLGKTLADINWDKRGDFLFVFLSVSQIPFGKNTLVCVFKPFLLFCILGCRLPQPSWLVPSSNPDQLLCLANEQSLTVATFNLSQEEFVGKVIYAYELKLMSLCINTCIAHVPMPCFMHEMCLSIDKACAWTYIWC